MAKKLTQKELEFCELYLKTRDYMFTKLKLGYSINISKKRIREYIEKHPIQNDLGIELDPIIRRLHAIATFDHALMYDKDGDIKPYRILTDEQKMAIAKYKENTDGTVSYTVHNQQDALNKLLAIKKDFLTEPKEDNTADEKYNITFEVLPKNG